MLISFSAQSINLTVVLVAEVLLFCCGSVLVVKLVHCLVSFLLLFPLPAILSVFVYAS